MAKEIVATSEEGVSMSFSSMNDAVRFLGLSINSTKALKKAINEDTEWHGYKWTCKEDQKLANDEKINAINEINEKVNEVKSAAKCNDGPRYDPLRGRHQKFSGVKVVIEDDEEMVKAINAKVQKAKEEKEAALAYIPPAPNETRKQKIARYRKMGLLD